LGENPDALNSSEVFKGTQTLEVDVGLEMNEYEKSNSN
jgi:hypothetical protein